MNWDYLSVAIVLEVPTTSALKASDGFTSLLPSVVVVGRVLIPPVGWMLLSQKLGGAAFLGVALVSAGGIVLNFLPIRFTLSRCCVLQ